VREQRRFFVIDGLAPLSAFCSSCKRKFTGRPNPGETPDDVRWRLRAEFDKHDCREGRFKKLTGST